MSENSKQQTVAAKHPRTKKDNSPFATPRTPAKYSTKKKQSQQEQPQPSYVDPAWRKAYRKAFASFVLYFDDLNTSTLKTLTRQTTLLGSTVEHFFSNKVTHLITDATVPSSYYAIKSKVVDQQQQPPPPTPDNHDDQKENVRITNLSNSTTPQSSSLSSVKGKGPSSRKPTNKRSMPAPPRMDIVSSAVKLGIKIWSVEKLQRILAAISEPNPVLKATSTPRDMSQCLRDEKVFGASAEFCPFKYNYILIEEATGFYRPIACREYPVAKNKNDPPWPLVRIHDSGKSPFLRGEEPEPKSMSEESKKSKNTNSQLPEKKRPAVLGSRSNGTNVAKTPKTARDDTGAIVDTAIAPAASAFATPFQKARKANSNASGLIIGGSAISNINSARCLPHAVTPKVQQEKLNVLIGKTVPADPKARSASKSLNAQSASAAKHQTTPSVPTAKKRKKNDAALLITKRPGFCENCYQKFDDMDEHMVSKYHREFATDPVRFAELDELLASVARIPKRMDDEHHSECSWFSSDDTLSSDDDNLWGASSDDEVDDVPSQTSKERDRCGSDSKMDCRVDDSGTVSETVPPRTIESGEADEYSPEIPAGDARQKSLQQLPLAELVGEVHDDEEEKRRHPPTKCDEQTPLVQGICSDEASADCENGPIQFSVDYTATQTKVENVAEPTIPNKTNDTTPPTCTSPCQNLDVRSTPLEPQFDGEMPVLDVNTHVENLSRPAEQVVCVPNKLPILPALEYIPSFVPPSKMLSVKPIHSLRQGPTPRPTPHHEISGIRVTLTSDTEVNCTDALQEAMCTSVGNPFIDESCELHHFQSRKKRRPSYDISASHTQDDLQNPTSFAVPSEVEMRAGLEAIQPFVPSQIPPESTATPIMSSLVRHPPYSPPRIQSIAPLTINNKQALCSSLSSPPPNNTITEFAALTSPNHVMPPTSATCLSSPLRKPTFSYPIASPSFFQSMTQDDTRTIPFVTMARTRPNVFPERRILRPVNTTLPPGYNHSNTVFSAFHHPRSPERYSPKIIRNFGNSQYQQDVPRVQIHSNPPTESAWDSGDLDELQMMCEKCETWINHDYVQFSEASDATPSQNENDERYLEGCKLALCKNCG